MDDKIIVRSAVLFSGPVEPKVIESIRRHLHVAMRKYVQQTDDDVDYIALHSIKHTDGEKLHFTILFEADDDVESEGVADLVEKGIISYFKLKSVKKEVGKTFKFVSMA